MMVKTALIRTTPFVAALVVASATSSQAELAYGLAGNSLLRFDTAQPGTIFASPTITGLQGDRLIGIDVRPETGGLYGLSSALRLYTLDPATGSASLVNGNGIGSFGSSFGFDFNPVVDAGRVVNNNAQNFRLSPGGALLGTDSSLAYAVNDPNFGNDPRIVGVAYANNNGDATTTSLYGIDSSTDTLTLIPAPNSGVMNTIGLLGVNTTERVGFDISGVTGIGYATLTAAGGTTSGLYQIDLASGKASFIGNLGVSGPLDGFTVASVPEPSTWALLGTGAVLLSLRRKFAR